MRQWRVTCRIEAGWLRRMAVFKGVYINLERNRKRRAGMERQFADAGAHPLYERFPAVDGKAVAADLTTTLDPGSLGLWLTHEQIVDSHAGAGRHLHVLEDDAVLPGNAGELFHQALRHADGKLGEWDLLFTETMVPFELYRMYAEPMARHGRDGQFTYLDLAPCYMACMSSFFVNRNSIGKYGRLIKGKWTLGMPVDMYVRRLIREKQLRAHVTVPFMTSISAESDQSDIRGELDRSHRVYDVFRRGFYLEADRPALLREMKALTEGTALGPLEGLYLGGLAFYLSDRWVRY